MSRIIEPFVSIFEDLMGCEENETDCIRDAKKYASIFVYGTLAIIIAIAAYKGHKMLKA